MKVKATWYFDFISPFAYLQWRRLQRLGIEGLTLRPVLFAGLLDHFGHKGPAEIPSKRAFTYRQVLWRAAIDGVTLTFPPAHPFNPLPALRLCVAAGSTPEVVELVFHHLWEQGGTLDRPEDLEALGRRLGIGNVDVALASNWVRSSLRANFTCALQDGVFGVPTLVHEGLLFWGDDATPMFLDYLRDPAAYQSAAMARAVELPVGAMRAAAG